MKKIISLVLVLVLAVSVFAACGDKTVKDTVTPTPETSAVSPDTSTPDVSQPEETGLSGKIVFSSWDIAMQDAYLLDMIEAFKVKNPGVEVQVNDIPSADYNEKLNVDLNGGAAADVFLIKDAHETVSYAKKGQVADLSEFAKASGVNLGDYNGLAENLILDGKQVAMPFRTDYYVLYYNKDIFDAAGEEYPSNDMTWTQFSELAKKLSSGEGVDRTYGAFLHTWQALVQNMAIQSGENTIMGPEYSFMKSAYELAIGMQNDRSIQDFATLTTGSIHYSGPFQQGTVAMLPMGTWYMSTMIAKINAGETAVNWGVATLPHPDGLEPGIVPGSITPIAMNAASENKEAAWALIDFMTGAEGAAMQASVGKLPGRLDSAGLATITSVEGMPEGTAEALQIKKINLDRPIQEYVFEVNQMLGEVHQLIMLEEKTVDEGLAEIELRSKEIQGIA